MKHWQVRIVFADETDPINGYMGPGDVTETMVALRQTKDYPFTFYPVHRIAYIEVLGPRSEP